jgi:hypothetical protein
MLGSALHRVLVKGSVRHPVRAPPSGRARDLPVGHADGGAVTQATGPPDECHSAPSSQTEAIESRLSRSTQSAPSGSENRGHLGGACRVAQNLIGEQLADCLPDRELWVRPPRLTSTSKCAGLRSNTRSRGCNPWSSLLVTRSGNVNFRSTAARGRRTPRHRAARPAWRPAVPVSSHGCRCRSPPCPRTARPCRPVTATHLAGRWV